MERVHYRRVTEPGTRRRGSEMEVEGVSDGRERMIMQCVVCAAMLAVVLAVRLIDTDLTSRIRVNLFHALSEQVSTENITVGFRQIKELLLGQNGIGIRTGDDTGNDTGHNTGDNTGNNTGNSTGNNLGDTIGNKVGGSTTNEAAGKVVETTGQSAAVNNDEAMLPATTATTEATHVIESGDWYIDEDVLAELDVSKLTVPELPVSPEP